jgi:hypothetical protein
VVRRFQAGKSWFHGENHFVAFLIRRCMDVVRGLPRRLRNRDWVVLIHEVELRYFEAGVESKPCDA